MITRLLFLLSLFAFMAPTAVAGENILEIPDIDTSPGVDVRIPVNLRNQDPVTAIELTLATNDMWWIQGNAGRTDRLSDDHSVSYSNDGNVTKILVYSLSNTPLNGSDGTVFYIPAYVYGYVEDNAELPITITDCILVRPDGRNISTGYSAGSLRIRETADLTPSNIGMTQSSVNPADLIDITWKIQNIGNHATYSGFREVFELIDDNGMTSYLGERQCNDIIPSGGSIDRQSTFRVASMPGIHGNVNIRLTIYPYFDCGESINAKDNNVVTSGIRFNLANVLKLSLPYQITEDNDVDEKTAVYTGSLSRSGENSNSLTVNLSLSPADSRISIPKTVTFPPHSSYVDIPVSIKADNEYQEDMSVSMTASAEGCADVTASFIASDGEQPVFSLLEASDEITEGEKMTFTLSRNVVSNEDLEVQIACEKSQLFRFPKTVTFPAGEKEVRFEVEAIDDTDISLKRSVMFLASAPGYESGQTFVTLIDNDMPEISMEMTPEKVNEDAGSNGVLVTVRRLSGSSDAIRLRINSDRPEDVLLPAEVILEKGVNELVFPIGVIDNAVKEGNRAVKIVAAVYSSECGCWASEKNQGYVEQLLTIVDNDGAALSLSAPATVAEGKNANVTIRRNTVGEKAVTVSLTSDTKGEGVIEFPSQITIAGGAQSATFEVKAPANDKEDDSLLISLYAEAEGYSMGSCRIMVTDSTLPDAVISECSASSLNAAPGETMDLSIVITNEGTASLPAKVPVSIMLDNTLLATAYTIGSISPGASETIVKSVAMPGATGEFSLKAIVNPDKKFSELITANNTSNILQLKVTAEVNASLSTDKTVYKPGEKISFSGKVNSGVKNGEEVDVWFVNNGLRSVSRVTTSADGSFYGEYTPYSIQTGEFAMGVDYPGDKSGETLCNFNVLGLFSKSSFGKEDRKEGETFTHKAAFSNLCSFPLTNVTATIVGSKPDEIVSVEIPSDIAAGEEVELTVTSAVLPPTPGNDWLLLPVRITSSEGLSTDYTLYYYAAALRGTLSLSETGVSTTMVKDSPRLYTVTLSNTGHGETGSISVDMPKTDWMSLISPALIPSLKSGESAEIVLRLSPGEGMQLNNIASASIALNASNANSVVLPVKAEAVSETTGILQIEVCDEYTYNTDAAPRVKGANVSVMHPATRKVLYSFTTGDDGLAEFEIPEGYYFVSVTEPSHSSFEGMLMLDPGKTTRKVVNIGIEGVKIDIRYEQTEIEDVYEIVTTVKYETNVPVPVVETILPESLDFDAIAPGESILFNVVLTNKGLITAQNTRFEIPGYDDPDYSFRILDENGFDLLPGQTRTLGVMVSRAAANSDLSRAPKKAPRASSGSCHTTTLTYYESFCGPDQKIHTQAHEIPVRECYGGPGGGNIVAGPVAPGWGPGGGSGILSGPGSNNGGGSGFLDAFNEKMQEYVDKFESWVCDPCTNDFMKAVANCNNFDPDHPVQSIFKKIPFVGDFLSCGFDIYNDYNDKKDDSSWMKYANSVAGCALMLCEKLGAVFVSVGTSATATGVGAEVGVPLAAVGKVMEVTCKWLGKGRDAYNCGRDLLKPCNRNGNKAPAFYADTQANELPEMTGYPSYIQQYAEKYSVVVDGREAIHNYLEEVLGDQSFLDASSSELSILFSEINRTMDADGMLDADKLLPFAPECVTEETFRAFILRQNNSTLKHKGLPFEGDCIDFDKLDEYTERISATKAYAEEQGYEDVAQMLTDSYIQMEDGYYDTSNSVCSSVTLALEQRMTMTRQAIRGTLTVVNGHETATLTDFKTYLNVYDADGVLVGADRLQIAVEELDGFTGKNDLESGWNLEADSEGTAKVLFIPTKKAAPEGETIYTFTGYVTYTDPFSGLETTRQLTPASLSIYPSPELYLTYFMQRDVIGDDPLTPNIVESSQPAEFALVVANRGKGDANNVSLAISQPRIVDNEKGLALDMRIVSSSLNGEPATLTPDERIVNNFGTIPSGTTAMAQWMLESNILGHFTDYEVEATHVSSYDNPDLSLLDGAEIHELIMGMTYPTTPEDEARVRCFVVNDQTDAFDTPDRIFFSDDRADQAVFPASSAELSMSGLSGHLTLTPTTPGWQYFAIPDPTYGMMEIAEVVRVSDGASIPVDNFRQSDRTLRDGHEPIYEYTLHGCLDANSVETYSLVFREKEETPVSVISWEGIPEEGTAATTAVENVKVTFNNAISPSSFSADDIKLLWQGETVDAADVEINQEAENIFSIDLKNLTSADGYYQLFVNLSTLDDLDGRHGNGWARCGWVMLGDGKYHVKVIATPADGGAVSQTDLAVEPGSKISVSANPAPGFTFQAWTENSEILSRDNTLELTVDYARELKALFIPVNHEVNVSLSDKLAGDLIGASSGLYPHNSEITLEASSESGWKFIGWSVEKNGKESLLSNEPKHTLIVEEDMHICAKFERLAEAANSEHTTRLSEGWNWVSFPLQDSSLDNPVDLLRPLGENFMSIRSEAESLSFDNNSWNGELTSLRNLSGYKMLMKNASSLNMAGSTLVAEDLSNTLEEGYSFIGCPLRRVTPVNDALANLSASEGDAIMGQNAMAVFNGSEWVGSLTALTPGAAYLVKSGERTTFNWPAQTNYYASTETLPVKEAEGYVVNPASYPDNMGVVIRLESELPIESGKYLVMAFDDITEECLGISDEVDGLHFLVVHNDASANTSFHYAIADLEENKMIALHDFDPVSFASSVEGSVTQPILINLDLITGVDYVAEGIEIYPNPVHYSLNISGCDDLDAVVTLIDMDGRLMLRHHGLENFSTLDMTDVPAGLYRLIVRSMGRLIVKPIIKE